MPALILKPRQGVFKNSGIEGLKELVFVLGKAGEQLGLKAQAGPFNFSENFLGRIRQMEMAFSPVAQIALSGEKAPLNEAVRGLGDIALLKHAQLHNVAGSVSAGIVVQKRQNFSLHMGQAILKADRLQQQLIKFDNSADSKQQFRAAVHRSSPSLHCRLSKAESSRHT